MAKLTQSLADMVLAESSVRDAVPKVFDEARTSYERGDRSVLMEVILVCALFQLVIPDWAVDALLEAQRGLDAGRLKDWNDALGGPDRSLAERRRLSRLASHRNAVLGMLMQVRNEGEPMNMHGAISEAASRLRASGVSVSPRDVNDIYKAHGGFLLKMPLGPDEDGKGHGVLGINMPLATFRRRGRKLWED